mgnify:CR=1 FL=1
MITIDPGKLNRRVTIQRKVEGRNGRGARIDPSWSDVGTVWAEDVPKASREYYRAAQVKGDMTHMIRMWYRSGVTSEHRLKLGATVLDILGPPRDPEDAHVLLEIDCVETEEG